MTVLSLASAASEARAAERDAVELDYQRSPGAEICPPREALSRLLSEEPSWATAAPGRRIRVQLRRDGARVIARLEIWGPGDAFEGRQELVGRADRCDQLLQSAALVLDLALERLTEGPPSAQLSAAPTPAETAAPTPPSRRLGLATGIGALGAIGLAPSASLGAMVNVEARWTRFSLGLEAQTNLASSLAFGAGQVSARVDAVSLVPCARLGLAGGCLVATIGRLEGSASNLPGAHETATPYVAAGARAFVDIPFLWSTRLRPAAELDVPLWRTSLRVNQNVAWATSPLAGSFSLSVEVPVP